MYKVSREYCVKFLVGKSTLLLLLYALLAVFFYIFLGRHILAGDIAFQFYADSLTYEKLYREAYFESVYDMLSADGNYLGPLLVLSFFSGDRLLVFMFNIVVFMCSFRLICFGREFRWSLFVVLVALSPITFSSLLSVNKEIFSILCFSLLVAWRLKGGVIYVATALVLSFLVRWQLALFIAVVWYSFSVFNPLRRKRLLFVILLLLAISLAFMFVGERFENVNAVAEQGAQEGGGSGVYSLFNMLQAAGLYFLVFIPKSLQAMYGLVFKVENVFSPSNVYNDIFVTLHCVVAFFVFSAVVFRRRLKLSDDFVFIAVVYCLIFVLSPIYAPRYFYPVYFLLCLVISRVPGSASAMLAR